MKKQLVLSMLAVFAVAGTSAAAIKMINANTKKVDAAQLRSITFDTNTCQKISDTQMMCQTDEGNFISLNIDNDQVFDTDTGHLFTKKSGCETVNIHTTQQYNGDPGYYFDTIVSMSIDYTITQESKAGEGDWWVASKVFTYGTSAKYATKYFPDTNVVYNITDFSYYVNYGFHVASVDLYGSDLECYIDSITVNYMC